MSNKIIYTAPEGGLCVVHPTGEIADLNELARMVVPADVEWEVVEEGVLPTDRTFRDAWVKDAPGNVCEDLEKSKSVGHQIRRAKRSEEFKPHDEMIALGLPGTTSQEAEVCRQEIRERYAVIETAMDAATDTQAIKDKLGL